MQRFTHSEGIEAEVCCYTIYILYNICMYYIYLYSILFYSMMFHMCILYYIICITNIIICIITTTITPTTTTTTTIQALLPIEHECFDYLQRTHLDAFLAHPAYRQLVRSGRRTVLLLFYQMRVQQEHNKNKKEENRRNKQDWNDNIEEEGGSDSDGEKEEGWNDKKIVEKELNNEITPLHSTSSPLHTTSLPLHHSTTNTPLLLNNSERVKSTTTNMKETVPVIQSEEPILNLPDMLSTSPMIKNKRKNIPRLSTMNSEELSLWLAHGGRRSSNISVCSYNSTTSSSNIMHSPIPLSMTELFPVVNNNEMKELKTFIRYVHICIVYCYI